MEELVSPHQEHEKGVTFKETAPLNLTIPNMFQCVNRKKKQDGSRSVRFTFFYSHASREKTWMCALFTAAKSWASAIHHKVVDFGGLAHLAPSRFQNIQIYQHPHSHSAGDTHSSMSSVSFSLKILIFWWIWARPSAPHPPPTHQMASTLSDLMRPNLHSKCYQNYH